MGTLGLDGVMRAWELEKLTTEQAIGQILQIIIGIEDRLQDLEHRYSRINRAMSATGSYLRPSDARNEERQR